MLLVLAAALQGCASLSDKVGQRVATLLPTDVLLLGEQHDATDHQRLQLVFVIELGRRGQLAALALEMASQGNSTAGLPGNASPDQVQAALQWNDPAWSWSHYGPSVMAAVRLQIPVLGANLPRSAMRAAMANENWDKHLDATALERQRDDIRSGHCQLLPESQIAPMTRIQIARDAAMAATAREARQPGKTVLLVAGGAHVLRGTGIPTHWPADVSSRVVLAVAGPPDPEKAVGVDLVWETAALPPKDHCAGLKARLGP